MAGNKTTIEIDGNSKGAILSINGVKKELTGLGSYIGGPFGQSMNMLSKHLAFAGVAAGIGGLIALTKQAINSGEEIYAMSQRVGVSVESLSLLKYAADVSELSLSQLEIALKKLSVNLYDVASGSGKDAKAAFDLLKISVTDASGNLKQTDQVLLDVADRFAKMKEGTEKTALAVKLFGKAGIEMIPFLNEGKTGIEALTNEAEKLGLKMSTEFARNADVFNDNLTAMGYALQGVGVSIATELMPFLISLSDSLKTYATDTNAASTAGAGFADVLKGIVTGLGAIYAGATIAGDALGTFYGTIATFLSTGSFTQAANVVSMGFDKIEKDALKFGNAFGALWTDNTSTYKKYLDGIKDDAGKIPTTTKNVIALYDAFGHPIDKDGNFTNNIQHIEALIKAQKQLGFDTTSQFSNLPSFDASQIAFTENDPFANVKWGMVDFFDMHDERAEQMRQNTSEMFGNMGSMAGQFYQASGQKAKQWFAMQKAFNVAQALMNVYEGATKALAQGGFFGIAMAATVIAAGLAQVAMIAAQQPGTGASGNAGAGLSAGTNNNITQPINQGVGDYNKMQTVYYITVQGNIVDHDKFARELVPSINKAVSDGVS